MSRLRKAAEIPAGSWTKWVVVGFWLAVLVITFPLAGKLTDYALLIVARYREELRRHDRRHAAMAEALRRA
jgi:uncharacterized membrane protein YdfJ with MMPL/SSD domain